MLILPFSIVLSVLYRINTTANKGITTEFCPSTKFPVDVFFSIQWHSEVDVISSCLSMEAAEKLQTLQGLETPELQVPAEQEFDTGNISGSNGMIV